MMQEISSAASQLIDFELHREELRKQLGRGMNLQVWPARFCVREPKLAHGLTLSKDWNSHSRYKSTLGQFGLLPCCRRTQKRGRRSRIFVLSREHRHGCGGAVRDQRGKIVAEARVGARAEGDAAAVACRL